MRGFVGNTDTGWFAFLRERQPIWEEVNFWSPSSHYTFRGEVGSPFLFRLKAPENAIGGFGIVSRFAKLPEWLAWECFGLGNGAPSLEAFQKRLDELRRRNRIDPRTTMSRIGCLVLAPALFFPRELWIPQPADWGRQNLRYKGYDLATGEGARIWRACLDRVSTLQAEVSGREAAIEIAEFVRRGEPLLIRPRLGQGGFRLAVTEAYRGACAVTEEHSLPALEAAHIRPYAQGGPHRIDNGLLLRSDLHRLFDRGYVTVTPDYRFEVSDRLRKDYENGRSYYPLRGRRLLVPEAPDHRPDPELLRWHNEHCFLSA